MRRKPWMKLDIQKWNAKNYAELSVVLYFSLSFWRAAFGKTLSFVGLDEYGLLCATILAYIPLIVACVKAPRKYIKLDAILLFAVVIIFFLVSYLLHPENKDWFVREDYGAWDHVLWLSNGLYAYMFVRLIDKPEDYFRLIKVAAVLMYVYFFYEIFLAMERGYWEGVAGQNAEAPLSYGLSYGYNVLFFALPFLYDVIKKHKPADMVMAFIGIKMVLDYGARGSMFCLIGFLGIVLITHILETKEFKKILLTYIIGLVFFAVCSTVWDMVTTAIGESVSGMGDSRFMAMAGSGKLLVSNGRFKIWDAAINMIHENPWGYGALGSRPVISKIIIAGYPHNLFLDLWIEFGVIIGSIIAIIFAAASVVILFRKNETWRPAFICAFSSSCALFISLTFWAYRPFWVTLAIVVNCLGKEAKRRLTKKKVVSTDE